MEEPEFNLEQWIEENGLNQAPEEKECNQVFYLHSIICSLDRNEVEKNEGWVITSLKRVGISQIASSNERRIKDALELIDQTPEDNLQDELQKLRLSFVLAKATWLIKSDPVYVSVVLEVYNTFLSWLDAKITETGAAHSKLASEPFNPIKWNDNVNKLTWLFERLADRKLVDFGSKENLKKALTALFIDKNGQDLKKDNLDKALKPNSLNKTQDPTLINDMIKGLE